MHWERMMAMRKLLIVCALLLASFGQRTYGYEECLPHTESSRFVQMKIPFLACTSERDAWKFDEIHRVRSLDCPNCPRCDFYNYRNVDVSVEEGLGIMFVRTWKKEGGKCIPSWGFWTTKDYINWKHKTKKSK